MSVLELWQASVAEAEGKINEALIIITKEGV